MEKLECVKLNTTNDNYVLESGDIVERIVFFIDGVIKYSTNRGYLLCCAPEGRPVSRIREFYINPIKKSKKWSTDTLFKTSNFFSRFNHTLYIYMGDPNAVLNTHEPKVITLYEDRYQTKKCITFSLVLTIDRNNASVFCNLLFDKLEVSLTELGKQKQKLSEEFKEHNIFIDESSFERLLDVYDLKIKQKEIK